MSKKKDKKAQQQADIIAQQRAREMSEVEDIFQKEPLSFFDQNISPPVVPDTDP